MNETKDHCQRYLSKYTRNQLGRFLGIVLGVRKIVMFLQPLTSKAESPSKEQPKKVFFRSRQCCSASCLCKAPIRYVIPSVKPNWLIFWIGLYALKNIGLIYSSIRRTTMTVTWTWQYDLWCVVGRSLRCLVLVMSNSSDLLLSD